MTFKTMRLSHLFFADDLVLFGNAMTQQDKVVNNILFNFCNHSRHAASINKSLYTFPQM